MSYIIAFVQLTASGPTYPVECFRTDMKVGDAVLVEFPNRPITPASVVQVRYLNWNCSAKVRCKVTEATKDDDGEWSLRNCPLVVGLTTRESLIIELKRRGWVSLRPSRMHRAPLTNSNTTASANILLRTNGVDLQILSAKRASLPRPFSLNQESVTEGDFVRHHLAHTTFNLFEGILRFANSFMADEGNYERFFKSVGASDKRTDELKEEAKRQRIGRADGELDNAMSDYYATVSDGSGDPVYMSDGMWLGDDGRLHDWGR